jgi:hypothetical protein
VRARSRNWRPPTLAHRWHRGRSNHRSRSKWLSNVARLWSRRGESRRLPVRRCTKPYSTKQSLSVVRPRAWIAHLQLAGSRPMHMQQRRFHSLAFHPINENARRAHRHVAVCCPRIRLALVGNSPLTQDRCPGSARSAQRACSGQHVTPSSDGAAVHFGHVGRPELRPGGGIWKCSGNTHYWR